MTTLRALLGRSPLTVEAHEPLSVAARQMSTHRVGSVCVLDVAGELVGICTEHDVVRACASGVDTDATSVRRWMTPDPVTAAVDDRVGDALRLMMDHGCRHLPVLGEGGLVGVVSLGDLRDRPGPPADAGDRDRPGSPADAGDRDRRRGSGDEGEPAPR